MTKTRIIIPVIVWCILFYLLSWQWDEWLSETMPRHQVIQLPAMFLLGILAGIFLRKIKIRNVSTVIAALIIVMATTVFWMLPRSVDMSVLNHAINRAMHVNMVIAGFLTVIALRGAMFEVRVIFLGMMAAMLLVAGFSLRAFNMLLCSSFNIWQQKETGLYFVIIGTALFVANVIVFFAGLRRPENL